MSHCLAVEDCGKSTVEGIVENAQAFRHDGLSRFAQSCGSSLSFCEVRFDLFTRDSGAGIAQRFLQLGAEPGSCAAPSAVSANGSAPSLAVRVSKIRTASETVIPIS